MDCKDCEQLLDAYAAGELSGEDLQKVCGHVEGCPQCAQKAVEYSKAMSALREAARRPPEADRPFFRSLRRRLDDADVRLARRTQPVLRWHFMGGVAAAAAAVLIVATTLVPYFNDVPPAEEIAQFSEGVSFSPVVVYPVGEGISALFRPVPHFPSEMPPSRALPGLDTVSKDEYRELEKRLGRLEARIRELDILLAADGPHEAANPAE
jgi:hypothetical protein